MARVIRGVKVYDLWSNAGDPVSSPSLGITIETLNGRSVAVMTFDEDGKKLSASWDSGYTAKSDMRAYPLPIAVSGGSISLLNDGWYQQFLNEGYSFKGCRVQRAWSSPTVIPLGNYAVEDVSHGIGELILTLGSISDSLVSDVAVAPLVVGTWDGMSVDSSDDFENTLFEGLEFYNPTTKIARSDNVYKRPTGYTLRVVPSDGTELDELVFPENSFARIKSGYGEGSFLSVPKGTILISTEDGKKYFKVETIVDYGMFIDDENTGGISGAPSDGGSLENMSIFEFFTSNVRFNAGEGSTIENAIGEDGKPIYLEYENGDLILPPIAKRWEAVPMNYPLMGGNDMLNNIGIENDLLYYDSNTGVYAKTLEQAPSVLSNSPLPVRDYDRSTFTAVVGIDSFASQWYVKTPSDDIEGLLVDFIVKYPSTPLSPNIQNRKINLKIVAEWNDDGDYQGVDHREIMLDTDLDFGDIEDKIQADVEFFNFNKEYYTPVYSDLEGSQLDERTVIFQRHNQNFRFLGGVERLRATNADILKSSPKRLNFILTHNVNQTDLDTVRLEMREIGFYGTPTETPLQETTITADITGKEGSWLTLGGAIENIASLQNFSFFDAVSIDVEENLTPVKTYITNQSDLASSVALKTILREAWYIGGLSRDGTTWKAQSAAGMIGVDESVPSSHYFRVPDVKLNGDPKSYDSENVPNSGTLTYGIGGDFAGKEITISNADSLSYESSFITGVTDSSIAESLWNMAHLIWLKTKTVVEIRNDASNLVWIYTEQGAIDYLVNLFDWNGGKGFSRKVISASFEVVDIDSTGSYWDIGDACRAYIPSITNTGDYSGVITGVEYNPESNTAIISTRVGQINQEIPILQEVGIVGGDTPILTEVDINTTEDANLTEVGV